MFDRESRMATWERIEDIEAWQAARGLTKEVYRVSGEGAFARDFALRDQVRRSAVSIGSNIAEGFERGGNKEFIQFLAVAKGSAGELRSQLYTAGDVGHAAVEQIQSLLDEVDRVGRMIGGLMKYLRHSPHKGVKYQREQKD